MRFVRGRSFRFDGISVETQNKNREGNKSGASMVVELIVLRKSMWRTD
jgi:hypothetical protein